MKLRSIARKFAALRAAEAPRPLREHRRFAIAVGRLRGGVPEERATRPAPTGAEALHFAECPLFVPAGPGALHKPYGTAPRFCACGGWASEARPDPTVIDIEFYARAIQCRPLSLRGGSGPASGEGVERVSSRTASAQPLPCGQGHRRRPG